MAKIIENGKLREMTQEEIDKTEHLPKPEPSEADILREKIAALEKAGLERDMALIELAAMLAGGGI